MMKISKSHKKETCEYTHIAHLEGVVSILYLGYGMCNKWINRCLEKNIQVVLFESPVVQSTIYTIPLLQVD